MINEEKSKIEKVDKKATFTYHYHRNFAIVADAPKGNDLELKIGETYDAHVKVFGLGEDMKLDIEGDGKMKLEKPTSKV